MQPRKLPMYRYTSTMCYVANLNIGKSVHLLLKQTTKDDDRTLPLLHYLKSQWSNQILPKLQPWIQLTNLQYLAAPHFLHPSTATMYPLHMRLQITFTATIRPWQWSTSHFCLTATMVTAMYSVGNKSPNTRQCAMIINFYQLHISWLHIQWICMRM